MGSRNSGAMFWAFILIAVGVIFLLQNMGVLSFNVWGSIWPIFIILLGVWLLFGNFMRGGSAATTAQSIPLGSTDEAHIEVNHGAGRLRVGASSDASVLVDSASTDGFRYDTRRDGTRANVRLHQERDWWSWAWPGNWVGRSDWSLGFNREIPLSLTIKTGASDSQINMRDLKVRSFKLETGASSSEVTVPANGQTSTKIEAGASSVRVIVPAGVAARIDTSTGAASVSVDQSRFPSHSGGLFSGLYQSPDYDTAENRADIRIEGGAASFEIR